MLRALELPAQVPQTTAFRLHAVDLAAVREALRAALVDGSLGPARALYASRLESYEAAVARARWRVPAATLGLVADVVAAAQMPSGDVDERGPEVGARLQAAAAALRGRAAAGGPVDVSPRQWRSLLVWVNALRRGHLPMMMAEMALRAFDALDEPTAAPIDHGPRGALEWTRAVRFFLEDAPGVEVPIERVTNVMRDLALHRQPLGSGVRTSGGLMTEVTPPEGPEREAVTDDEVESTPYAAAHVAADQIAVDALVEVCVGPFVQSRGPSAFLAPGGAALVDERWAVLPLWRKSDDIPVPGSGFRVIEGALEYRRERERLRAIGSTPPALVDDGGDDDVDVTDPWRWRSAAALASAWPAFRDRYAALLDEAEAAGDAVVSTEDAPDDQGEMGPAAGVVWGAPTQRRG